MAPTRFTVQLYAAVPDAPVNWRLLSGNNRECGRGDGGFADAEQCRRFIADLQASLPRVRHRNRRADAHRWGWELRLEEQTVALSGHSFDRLVRCEQGMRVFVAEFAAAGVRDGLVVTGSRRWGSVA